MMPPVIEPGKALLDLLQVFRKTRPFFPELQNIAHIQSPIRMHSYQEVKGQQLFACPLLPPK